MTTFSNLHPPIYIKQESPDDFSHDVLPMEGHCTEPCHEDAICSFRNGTKSWVCWCFNVLREQKDGKCDPPDHETTNNETLDIFSHSKLKHIVFGNESNKSVPSMLTENAHASDTDWEILQIIIPIAVVLVLFLVLTLVALKKWRSNRRKSKRGSDGVIKNSDNVQLLERMNIISKNPTYFSSLHDAGDDNQVFIRELPLEHLKLVDIVGEGAFGQVFKGELYSVEEQRMSRVAVKVLKEGATQEVREDFEREVEIMSSFDHDNILRLVGVVTKDVGESPYMVFEYMDYGDLAELLRKNDPILRKPDDIQLQKNDLVDISTQIANGMRYLTSQHFVHRDLATRNCLVGGGLIVKISDFGMSRDIYTCDYYKIGGSRMLPVRWMSPESVKYGRFTTESDVWAFGVVLWEVFSCGRQPYYGHSNEEVIRFLADGLLLQRPEDCPSTIYHIMLGCWKQEPKSRKSFETIHHHLEDYNKRIALNLDTTSSETGSLPIEKRLTKSECVDIERGLGETGCLKEEEESTTCVWITKENGGAQDVGSKVVEVTMSDRTLTVNEEKV